MFIFTIIKASEIFLNNRRHLREELDLHMPSLVLPHAQKLNSSLVPLPHPFDIAHCLPIPAEMLFILQNGFILSHYLVHSKILLDGDSGFSLVVSLPLSLARQYYGDKILTSSEHNILRLNLAARLQLDYSALTFILIND